MGVKYLSDQGPDGACLGKTSSEPIAFYGGTPVAQHAITSTALVTSTAVSSTTNGLTSWGFSSSSLGNQIVTMVNEIKETLVTLGLMA